MTIHPVVIPVDDRRFPARLALPSPGPAPAPGVLFFHGSDGFGPHHTFLARELATAGYAALVPTWFGVGAPYPHWDGLVTADVQAFWQYLGNRPEVARDRRALAGASRGGGLAAVAASRLTGVRGVVNFFGLTRWGGPLGLEEMVGLEIEGGDSLGFLATVTAPILSFHGEADTVVPAADTRRLDTACRRLGLNHQARLYPGIDHSFLWHGNTRFHQPTRDHAWAATLEFLARVMADEPGSR
jgi:dienelactone hydrolase